MCEQCLTNPIFFGEPIPGFTLARARRQGNDWNIGDWGLIECNSPTYTWSITPTPNPCWGMSDDEESAWYETVDHSSSDYQRWNSSPYAFIEAFEDCGVVGGYNLVKAAIEKGYDPEKDGNFGFWFFDYLGEYLKTVAGEPDDEICFPARDEMFPMDISINKDPLPSEPKWMKNDGV